MYDIGKMNIDDFIKFIILLTINIKKLFFLTTLSVLNIKLFRFYKYQCRVR